MCEWCPEMEWCPIQGVFLPVVAMSTQRVCNLMSACTEACRGAQGTLWMASVAELLYSISMEMLIITFGDVC